jgi:hypothetical protein
MDHSSSEITKYDPSIVLILMGTFFGLMVLTGVFLLAIF